MSLLHKVMAAFVALLMATAVSAQEKTEHVLGPGDTIHISVYQNPDLTLDARISETGLISYPLLGTISLKGVTSAGAEQKLSKALRDGGFVLKPQVNVSLTQIRSSQVSILGQVGKPGRYPIESVNVKLSEMIAVAGGVIPTGADVLTVVGQRHGKPAKFDVDLPLILQQGKEDQDVVMEDGDIVFVDRAPNFYIYGEIGHPGVVRLERGMTVLQALAESGGVTQRGTEKGLRVHRRDASGTVQVLDVKLNDPVQRDDVIYVRESIF